jgi:hypothetical protein
MKDNAKNYPQLLVKKLKNMWQTNAEMDQIEKVEHELFNGILQKSEQLDQILNVNREEAPQNLFYGAEYQIERRKIGKILHLTDFFA